MAKIVEINDLQFYRSYVEDICVSRSPVVSDGHQVMLGAPYMSDKSG